MQLNFKDTDQAGNFKLKQYHENYGFNLKEVIEKYPILELKTEQGRDDLIRSLEKGNKQSVTLDGEGNPKMFVEANPQFKTLNIYDSNAQKMRNVQKGENQAEGKEEKESQHQGKAQKKEIGEGGEPERKQKQHRSKRQSI